MQLDNCIQNVPDIYSVIFMNLYFIVSHTFIQTELTALKGGPLICLFIKKSVFFEIFSIKLRFVAVSGNARMIILEYSKSPTTL